MKILLLCSFFFFSFNSFCQNPEIEEANWNKRLAIKKNHQRKMRASISEWLNVVESCGVIRYYLTMIPQIT